MAQGRTFLPIVFTTLGGIGPPEAVHYLDALFSDSYASELAATGSTRNTAHARRLFYQSLLATLTKATANMASALTLAASEASAAGASSATNPASPPDLAPSTTPTTPMTPSSSPTVHLHLSTRSYRRHTPALISRGSVRAPPGPFRMARCSLNRFISLGRSSRLLCCALAHSVLGFHTNKP